MAGRGSPECVVRVRSGPAVRPSGAQAVAAKLPVVRPPSEDRAWRVTFAIAAAVIVTSHLVGLASAPPGLHSDGASIGYNAWTIAHYGTDQYGARWPLLFRDLGDYKGPISTYLLAPLTLFLPLTPAVTRLPSAFAGIALAVVAALLAWRLTRSRWVALLVLLEAAFEPWFFHTARINLEADLFTVLCFVAALAVLGAGGDGGSRPRILLRNCALAGLALGLAPLAAQPGRYFAIVFLALVIGTNFRLLRWRPMALLSVPPLISTLAVFLSSPAGATARLANVSAFNHESIEGGLAASFGNYLQYFGPNFLFIRGDPILRHSSGFGGVLFLTAIPVLLLGVMTCIRRWREPMCRLALVGALIAPLGPAVTGGISARRDVVFLPFLILLLIYGWENALTLLRGRPARVALASACVVVVAGAYFADYAIAYPNRAAAAFDAGEVPALAAAHRAAGGHTIFVSERIRDVSELALFAILPPPSASDILSRLHIVVVATQQQLAGASPGDVAVLSGTEQPPVGFRLLDRESVTGPTSLGGPPRTVALITVYQRS
jgi:hypothetical protein